MVQSEHGDDEHYLAFECSRVSTSFEYDTTHQGLCIQTLVMHTHAGYAYSAEIRNLDHIKTVVQAKHELAVMGLALCMLGVGL